MKATRTHIKFLKREERDVFDKYYEAISCVRFDGQKLNLDLVRKLFIEGDYNLTQPLWINFCQVLHELDISHPIYNVNKNDIGKGSCYNIPVKNVKNASTHFKLLLKRQKWRTKFRTEFEQKNYSN